MIISFQPVLLEVPWGAPGRKAWRYSRSAGKVRAVHVDGGWEQQQKTHSFPHQSLWEWRCMWARVCVGGVHVSMCVCVCGGGANRIPRPCYCLGFLKVTMCLETPLPVLPLWATSWPLLPPPAVTVCTPRGLPKPSPTHTSSQNLRASHQVTLGVKTQFMAKEHEISGPRCRGTGIHTQWCQTPKLYSLPGTRTRWQKGLLSSLMVERWSGPSARKGLKSHTGWEICTKGVLLVLRLNSTAGPVGLRVPSFTVAQLLRVHNREEEWGRQSPPQAQNERKMVFPDSHRQVPGAIWGWSLQAGWFEMLPNGYHASKSQPRGAGAEPECGKGTRELEFRLSSHPHPRPARVCLTPQGCCVPSLSSWFVA